VQISRRGRFGAERKGPTLRETGQNIWWRKTGRLAAATLAAAFVLCLAPLLFIEASKDALVLGMPLAYFLVVLAAPFAIFVAIFWFAEKQRSFDHRYDVAGD